MNWVIRFYCCRERHFFRVSHLVDLRIYSLFANLSTPLKIWFNLTWKQSVCFLILTTLLQEQRIWLMICFHFSRAINIWMVGHAVHTTTHRMPSESINLFCWHMCSVEIIAWLHSPDYAISQWHWCMWMVRVAKSIHSAHVSPVATPTHRISSRSIWIQLIFVYLILSISFLPSTISVCMHIFCLLSRSLSLFLW